MANEAGPRTIVIAPPIEESGPLTVVAAPPITAGVSPIEYWGDWRES